jgi:hypothetical protein
MNSIVKGISYVILTIVVIATLLISYIAVDHNARRYIFIRIAPAYNLYQHMIMRERVQEREFQNISESLLNYLEISEMLSDGKSKMLVGIVNVVEEVAERATSTQDFQYLERVFRKLIELDPNLYKARVWLARALIKKDPEEAVLHIQKAMQLSASNESAYREIINIVQNTDFDTEKLFCKKYFSAQFGETQPRSYRNYFGGLGLNSFALEFTNNKEKINLYPHSGLQLQTTNSYEFTPLSVVDANGFNLYLSTLPGLKITIKKINIYTEDSKYSISGSEFSISSKHGYVINDTDGSVSLVSLASNDDEKLSIRYESILNNINKVELIMSFERLPLTNSTLCQ